MTNQTEIRLDRNTIESALTHFVVIGPGFWGKGKTPCEALKNARKQGLRATSKAILFAGDSGLSVTSEGWIEANALMVRLGEIQ